MFKTDSVAILLATYNGEKFLREQFDSILAQTYQNFVIYISDDLSNDKTPEIIKEYTEKFCGKIINICNTKHFGNARDNFFNLLCKVDAPYYMFCDQDDFWEYSKIEKTINALQESTDIPTLVYCDLAVVDKNRNIIQPSFRGMYPYLKAKMDWHYYIHSNDAPGCTMCFNKALADLYKQNYANLCNENIVMHDSFFITVACIFGNITYIDEPLIQYRQHGKNTVGAENRNSILHILKKFSLSSDKKLFYQMQKQIGEILKIEQRLNIELEMNDVLQQFSKLYEQNKFKRIMFMFKNGLLKNGVIRCLRWLFVI